MYAEWAVPRFSVLTVETFDKMLDSQPKTLGARDSLVRPLRPTASDAQLVCCSWSYACLVWVRQLHYAQMLQPSYASTLPCVAANELVTILPVSGVQLDRRHVYSVNAVQSEQWCWWRQCVGYLLPNCLLIALRGADRRFLVTQSSRQEPEPVAEAECSTIVSRVENMSRRSWDWITLHDIAWYCSGWSNINTEREKEGEREC